MTLFIIFAIETSKEYKTDAMKSDLETHHDGKLT